MTARPSITLGDVARRAGVAPITVSRVISETSYVSAQTRRKVEAAIEELGFIPDALARGLVVGRTRTVAFVATDILNPFYATIFRGIEDVLDDKGITVFVGSSDRDPAKEKRLVEAFISRRVDGLVVAPRGDERNLKALADRQIPLVTVVYDVSSFHNDCVIADNVAGARALTNHLITLGHRQIALIGGPLSASTARDRLAGFRLALDDHGLSKWSELERSGEYSKETGYQQAIELLQSDLRPTAIFAGNNTICLGVLAAVRELGLRVPEDLALVSFDDFEIAAEIYPFLTVASEPAYKMGRLCAEMLLQRIEGAVTGEGRRVVLPVKLVIRRSCGTYLQTMSDRFPGELSVTPGS